MSIRFLMLIAQNDPWVKKVNFAFHNEPSIFKGCLDIWQRVWKCFSWIYIAMIEIWNSLPYAKSHKMWWDTCCKIFIQFGWETKKLEFSSGLFLILAKTLQGWGSLSFWPNDLKPSSSWSWTCPQSSPSSREKSI